MVLLANNMRIIHLIPAAFEYFDDIRDAAFRLAEEERQLGLEVDAFAIQYGSVTQKFSAEVKEQSPSSEYQETVGEVDVIDLLDQYDVVHLHFPMLGVLGRLIKWKKMHPAIPLVVTHHRNVVQTDLFSLFIVWYTMWYRGRLFRLADEVVTSPATAEAYASLYEDLLGY